MTTIDVVLPLLLAVAMGTVGGSLIWWLCSLSDRLRRVEQQLKELQERG